MPIKQERFNDIIRAARAFFTSTVDLQNAIANASLAVEHKTTTAQAALDRLASFSARIPLYHEHTMNLAREEKHYQLTSRKNAWQAEKQRLRRLDQGIPTRQKPKGKEAKIDDWEFEMEGTATYDNIAAAASVIEIGAEQQVPQHADVTGVIDFGPEPTPIEQSQQILADIAEKEDFERELAALKARNAEKGLSD